MPAENYGIPVFEYEQPGGVFYACIIPAKEIIDRLEVRRRSVDPKIGIQRDENLRRVRDIAEYASGANAVFPTPIIVSASTDVVSVTDSKIFFNHSEGIVGHVLDGQHRVLGLRSLSRSQLTKFSLLVVFVFDIDLYSEATIFSTINGNQKQVSKSLMYDLFDLDPRRSVEKACHEIARSLHDDAESPFYARLKLLGTKMGPNETLSQAAFIDHLARQVKEKRWPLQGFYANNEDWVIRKVMANCFFAINAEWKKNPGDFPENYFYRTTGFGGVVQALGELVGLGAKRNDISVEYFSQVMSEFFNSTQAPPTGVGNAAMLEIKRKILEGAHKVVDRGDVSTAG